VIISIPSSPLDDSTVQGDFPNQGKFKQPVQWQPLKVKIVAEFKSSERGTEANPGSL